MPRVYGNARGDERAQSTGGPELYNWAAAANRWGSPTLTRSRRRVHLRYLAHAHTRSARVLAYACTPPRPATPDDAVVFFRWESSESTEIQVASYPSPGRAWECAASSDACWGFARFHPSRDVAAAVLLC